MSASLNETHDPELQSWVASAQFANSDFPIQNLPFGVFRRAGSQEQFRIGVAIGHQILDMQAALRADAFSAQSAMAQEASQACGSNTLNNFMALGQAHWSALRLALSRLLRSGAAEQAALDGCLVAQPPVPI